MVENKELTVEELYYLSEEEIIYKIENAKEINIAENFKKFRKATKVLESDEPVKNKYCVSVPTKRRYIIPLVKTNDGIQRINQISREAKNVIDEFLAYEPKKYAYLDLKL
jgi:hypothetical protein